jgi:hypothetical protein
MLAATDSNSATDNIEHTMRKETTQALCDVKESAYHWRDGVDRISGALRLRTTMCQLTT